MQSSFMSTPAHAGCPRLRGRLFRLLIVAADWLADMYRSMGRVKVWNMPRTQDSLRLGVARPWFTVSAVTNSPWCIKTVNKLFLLKTSSPLLTSSLPRLTSDRTFHLTYAYRDGRSGKGQAEQHQQGDNLMVGVNVGQAQASVMAVKARLHWLEHICPLQEVQTDHRWHQDWQLSKAAGDKRKKTWTAEAVQDLIE